MSTTHTNLKLRSNISDKFNGLYFRDPIHVKSRIEAIKTKNDILNNQYQGIYQSNAKEFFKERTKNVSSFFKRVKHTLESLSGREFEYDLADLEPLSGSMIGNNNYINLYSTNIPRQNILDERVDIPIGKLHINGDISISDSFNQKNLTDDEMFAKYKRNDPFNSVIFDNENKSLTVKTLRKDDNGFSIEENHYSFDPDKLTFRLAEVQERNYDNDFNITFDRQIFLNDNFNSFDPMIDMNGEMDYNDDHFSYQRFEKYYKKGVEHYSYESSFEDGVENFRLTEFSQDGKQNITNGTIHNGSISFDYKPSDIPFDTTVNKISLHQIGQEITPQSLEKAIKLSQEDNKLSSQNVAELMKKKAQEKHLKNKSKTQP